MRTIPLLTVALAAVEIGLIRSGVIGNAALARSRFEAELSAVTISAGNAQR